MAASQIKPIRRSLLTSLVVYIITFLYVTYYYYFSGNVEDTSNLFVFIFFLLVFLLIASIIGLPGVLNYRRGIKFDVDGKPHISVSSLTKTKSYDIEDLSSVPTFNLQIEDEKESGVLVYDLLALVVPSLFSVFVDTVDFQIFIGGDPDTHTLKCLFVHKNDVETFIKDLEDQTDLSFEVTEEKIGSKVIKQWSMK